MSTVLKHGLIYTGSEKIVDGYLRFDKQIINVGPMSEYKAQVSDDKIIDLEGQVVVPGFIDVHSHGGYSFDSMDGDANQIDEMVNDMVHEGITTYFATTMTQSHENIAHAMVGIKEAAAKNPVIQGIHLEGPFVSPVFKANAVSSSADKDFVVSCAMVCCMKRWMLSSLCPNLMACSR